MSEHDQARRRAREILDPVFARHGFRAQDGPIGHGSSGAFAMWTYKRAGRRAVFETRDRFPLMVAYELADPEVRVDHTSYMRHVSDGRAAESPNGDPVARAKAVAGDLEAYGSDFLEGTGDLLRGLARELDEQPSGFAAITAAERRVRSARTSDAG